MRRLRNLARLARERRGRDATREKNAREKRARIETTGLSSRAGARAVGDASEALATRR